MLDVNGLEKQIEPLVNQGQYKEALDKCLEVWSGEEYSEEQENPWMLLLLGRLYHRAGILQQAKIYFNMAATFSGGDTEVLRRVEMFKLASELVPNSRTDIENFCDPDVILVQAPAWGVNTPPLAIAMLTAYARNRGYKVLPIDLNIEFFLSSIKDFDKTWELEQSLWFWTTKETVRKVINAFQDKLNGFVKMVAASKAPIVGFSVYGTSLIVSLEISDLLKKQNPDLKIIFGGPHVSRFTGGPSTVLEPSVDAIVNGEGELTLIDIIDHVKSGSSLDNCPGLMFQLDGQTVDTGDRELVKDLNDLPAPDFSDYSFERYRTPTRLPLMSSRGCPNRCIFCNERPFWKKYRYRTADNIFAEVQAQLKRYPFVDFLDFQDSLVNGVIRELEKLADMIIESGIKVQWAGQAVIRREMTEELMRKLKRSGCVCMAYGMETPSSELMLKVGKVVSRGADANKIAEAHAKTGLGAVYNIMFGLPGETEEDSFEVQEFVRRNYKNNLVVNPSPSFCGFSPGTLGYENPEEYGIDFSKGGLYWESTDGQNTFIRRLKRFEDFCRLVSELKVSTAYPATHLLDRNRQLGHYYFNSGDKDRAKYYYESWLKDHPEDQEVKSYLEKVLLNQAV